VNESSRFTNSEYVTGANHRNESQDIATMIQVRNLKRVEGMEIYRKFESYSPLYNLHTYSILFILSALTFFT